MMMQNWTTSDLPAHEQFGYWREVICSEFTPLMAKRVHDKGAFRGGICAHQLAELHVAGISSEAQTVNHGRREVATADAALYFLLLQKEGAGYVSQGRNDCVLLPGDFTLIDTERPYELRFDNSFEQLCINIPQHMLRAKLANPEKLTALKVGGEDTLARLGLSYLKTIEQSHQLHVSADNEKLANNFLDFLPLIFNARLGTELPLSRYKNVQLDVLQDFIHRQLANPSLNPALAADYLGVSVRYVHKAFSASGTTFGRYVLRERLKRCASDLQSTSHAGRSIAEIAYQWGFNDLSYFGKCFKKYFEQTPREWRQMSR
ncbi:MAG: helix-turn-helix domain-containing protein [Pseudomonadota bacterium]